MNVKHISLGAFATTQPPRALTSTHIFALISMSVFKVKRMRSATAISVGRVDAVIPARNTKQLRRFALAAFRFYEVFLRSACLYARA